MPSAVLTPAQEVGHNLSIDVASEGHKGAPPSQSPISTGSSYVFAYELNKATTHRRVTRTIVQVAVGGL
jgi:hypothetical protein